MTKPSRNLLDDELSASPCLPLVSIVVVNYNYGRFLRQAIASVETQTYGHIECIIVDNASTDCSHDVLDDISQSFPQARILRRDTNGGQTAASFDGLDAARGEYVIFLDADDYLLPRAVETHIFCHLSLRIPVGFTSGDILQCIGNEVTVSTSPAFSDFVTSGKGRRSNFTRSIIESVADLWMADQPPVALEKLHYCPPPEIATWIWSPTSANCFRKEALKLMRSTETGAAISGTDAYFLQGISSLCGSVLIDHPVAVYRLHGSNVFSNAPSLNRLKSFDNAKAKSNTEQANKAILRHFIANLEVITARLHNKYDMLRAIEALDSIRPKIEPDDPAFDSFVSEQTYRSFKRFARIYGKRDTVFWLKGLRVPIWKVIGLLVTPVQPSPGDL